MAFDGPIVASGSIAKGKLKIRQSNRLATELQALRDGEVTIEIRRARATRSRQQNSYYWVAVVGLVAEHTGYTPDEIHEIYKAKFLPKRLSVANANGEIQGEFVIGGTTTKLTTLGFGEYCEEIRRWAAETLDVFIPDPGT